MPKQSYSMVIVKDPRMLTDYDKAPCPRRGHGLDKMVRALLVMDEGELSVEVFLCFRCYCFDKKYGIWMTMVDKSYRKLKERYAGIARAGYIRG